MCCRGFMLSNALYAAVDVFCTLVKVVNTNFGH